MVKYIIVSIFLFSGIVYGQSIDLNDQNRIGDLIEFDQATLDKYIEIASSNMPNGKVAQIKTLVAKKDVELARWSWSETLVAQFNLNESNIGTSLVGGEPNIYYPRYLFGLRVNMGTFVLTPLETKKASELYKISLVEQDYQKSVIATEVTKKYQAYILKQKNLILRLNSETKITSLYNALKNSNQNRDLAYLEKEAQIYSSYTQVQESKNIAEAEVRIAKVELEQLLGAKLENIR